MEFPGSSQKFINKQCDLMIFIGMSWFTPWFSKFDCRLPEYGVDLTTKVDGNINSQAGKYLDKDDIYT